MKKNLHKYIIGVLTIVLVLTLVNTVLVDAQEPVDGLNELCEDESCFIDVEGNVVYLDEEPTDIVYEEEFDVSNPTGVSFRSFSSRKTEVYGVVESRADGTNEVLEVFDTYEDANTYFETNNLDESARIYMNNRVVKIHDGLVNFKKQGTASNKTVNYTEVATGRAGYMHPFSAPDAAYIETSNDGKRVRFVQAGVMGWVDSSEVELISYSNPAVRSVNYYVSKNGLFYHYLISDIRSASYTPRIIGPAQTNLDQGVPYYSYDGHYFYTSYKGMIDDYRNGVHSNAKNANQPYYNYYQFQSHRSITQYSAQQLDSYINANTSSTSKLRGTGASFISNQTAHGTNAAMMLGVAIHESGWGNSSIAQSKNNLFGHSVYDSNTGAATVYSSPQASIDNHSRNFLSIGFLDSLDWRYNGGHLGDKASGIGVKYASDPFWGEKVASFMYSLDLAIKGSIQEPTNTIGVIEEPGTIVNIRREATTSSQMLYQNKANGASGGVGDYPFLILQTVQGESVNGNSVWYKIQADPTLNANRTAITQYVGNYDFTNNYAYVHSGAIKVVHTGNGGTIIPSVVSIRYSAHIQGVGWGPQTYDGAIAGSNGKGKNLEALQVVLSGLPGHKLSARVHVANEGWRTYANASDVVLGTTGKNRGIEALSFQLEGVSSHKLQYRVKIKNLGWLSWTDQGKVAGTTGSSTTIEDIQMRLVASNTLDLNPTLYYQAHVRNIGWQAPQPAGAMIGTTGRSLGMEAMRIALSNVNENAKITGSVHIQNVGWVSQSDMSNGLLVGTTGKTKSIEAVNLQLVNVPGYKLQYRVHVQNVGWMNWVDQGTMAGTTGRTLPIEAIEIRIVKE